METNENNIDLAQPLATNTDPFLNPSASGGVSESVKMADMAAQAPFTTVEQVPLSKSLIGMTPVDRIAVPSIGSFSPGGQSNGGLMDMINISKNHDNRLQSTKYDVDQDDIYTKFTSKGWEDWSGFGKVSRYSDKTYIKGSDNEDRLAREQSNWEMWGRGIEKGLQTASSMVLNTVGMIGYGIPKAIEQKSFSALIDNEFSRFIDDFNTQYQHEDMIYKSNEYKNASVLGQLKYGTLYADSMLQGLGYLLGGLAVGGAAGAGLKAAGLGAGMMGGASRAALGNLTKSALTGDISALGSKAVIKAFKGAIKADLAKTTVKTAANNLATLIVSAAPEAQMESLSFIKEDENQFVEKFSAEYNRPPSALEMEEYKAEATSAANGVFAANLALVGSSNLLQFGDLLGADKILKKGILDDLVNKTFGLGIERSTIAAGKEGLESAAFNVIKRTRAQKAGYRVFTALQSPVTEGLWEEGMQSAVGNTASDYMQARFDPNSTDKNRSIIESFGKGLAHTYGSKEGWQEIMMGMMIGGIGTVRGGKSGFDFLGQRAASGTISKLSTDVQNLNKTQGEFIEANEQMLKAQNMYNSLDNQATIDLNKRLGNTNQQIAESDKARIEAAKGNLEQAQLHYTNSVFAKLMAEERAGLSDSNKFDMDMMIDNIPEETLKEMYGFRSQEEMYDFKERTKQTLEFQKEAFKVSKDFADQLNIGVTNTMSAENLKEASALHFFHGMMAGDNASTIAKSIQDTVGIGGVADAMNYYANLTQENQQRVQQRKQNETELSDLETKRSELLESFSRQSEKLAREPENEANVRALDAVTTRMAALDNDILRLTEENGKIDTILSNQANIPRLPFGNPASKFFAGVGLNLADTDVTQAMDTLGQLETYIDHLQDTTGKSEDQVKEDANKADVLQSMVNMYQGQVKNMRNFAKVANMVSDPSYGNNLYKRIRRKRDTKFDSQAWIDNDASGFDVNNEGALNPKLTTLKAQLQEMVDAGKISEFDMHTWVSNAEILSMHGQRFGDSKISLGELTSVISRDDNGNMIFDQESDLGKEILDTIVSDLVNSRPLSPAQTQVYMLMRELIQERVNEELATQQSGIAALATPGNNPAVAQQQRLRRIADAKIDKLEREFEEKYPISKIVSGEVTLPGTEGMELDDLTLDEVMALWESQLLVERDRVEAEYQEALNPTQQTTQNIVTALDQLNEVINEVVRVVKEVNREINEDVVDEFNSDFTPTVEDFNKVKTLLNKGVRTAEEQVTLEDLLKKINDYGLIEGRVGNSNGDKIRMSDLLEQRAQLENEIFADRKDSSPLTNEEMKMTFESPTDEKEADPEFSTGQATGDAAVLNSYEFSTFTPHGSSSYQVSNVTPQGFTEEVVAGRDFVVTVTDLQGNIKAVDISDPAWDKQLAAGDTVMVDILDNVGQVIPPFTFSIDQSRRVIIPIPSAEVISSVSPLSFNAKNKIGSSAHYILTRVEEGVETYLGSDFNIELDSDATQKLNPGDPIYFEYDEEFPYNISLKEEYDATHPDENSNVNFINNRVEDLISEIEDNRGSMTNKEATAANSKLFRELRDYFPNVSQNNIRSFRSASKKMVDEYNKSFDSKKADEVKRKFKDNMVLVAMDKNGNRVGIVKSLNNSRVNGNGRTRMDYLRTSVFEQLVEDGFTTGTRSKFTVPVQIMYMGIPNIRTEQGEKVLYRFSDEVGDRNINPSKIKAVGYATEGSIVFNDGKKRDTPYNYAKKVMTDTTFAGKKVPVVVFEHNGKEVIYPVGLVENDSEPMSARFQQVLDQEANMSHGDFVKEVNTFLAENGIAKDVRVTSLEFKSKLEAATAAVANAQNLPTIDELMTGDFKDILRSNGFVDINLNDKPFVGPKIRFKLNEVPEISSNLLTPKGVEIKASTLEQILENEEDQNCLD